MADDEKPSPWDRLREAYGSNLDSIRTTRSAGVTDLTAALAMLNGVDEAKMRIDLVDYKKPRGGMTEDEVIAAAVGPYEAMAHLLDYYIRGIVSGDSDE